MTPRARQHRVLTRNSPTPLQVLLMGSSRKNQEFMKCEEVQHVRFSNRDRNEDGPLEIRNKLLYNEQNIRIIVIERGQICWLA
jgi:hypothetical protein